MSRHLTELEGVLQMLIDEHKKLLNLVDSQQSAMKTMKLDVMQDLMHRQESSRSRISNLEVRRKLLVSQMAKLARINGPLTLQQIAEMFPQEGAKLLKLRDHLRGLMQQIADRTHVAGRLSAAILGHLNTAMRLFAGAVGQAGIYTKTGAPRVVGRIGVMEAVG